MDSFFHNTLSPWQWAVVAAVPPAILALYFLKLKRVPLETPSTYLWARTVEDLRVNSLWQRLRRSLLLLMQLVFVGLAILALARPGWRGTEVTGGRLIFLVDNSASMSTTDATFGGEESLPRLDAAKQRIVDLIDQMGRGVTAMIVSFAGEPRVVQQFTDNQRLLRERLATVEPTAERTDLAGALELADGLANPAQLSVQEGAPEADIVPPEPATLYAFTDGRFSAVEGFSLGNLDPVYVPVGSADTGNLAITALETRRTEGELGALVAFVQASNLGTTPAEAVVELRRGGRVIDAHRLKLPAGESSGITVPIGDATPAPGEGSVEARLTRESVAAVGDKLPLDDAAFAAVNDPADFRVLLVTTGNPAIEQALATERIARLAEVAIEPPAFLESPAYRDRAAAGGYGLVIFDRCRPAAAPQGNGAYVGSLPPGTEWATAEGNALAVPQVIDWRREHPLLAHLELGDFDIVDAVRLAPPPGGLSLIDASEGPIAAIAARDGYEDLVVGFPILVEVDGTLQRNTDWINRHSFPTFWLNVVEYFAATRSVGERSLRPGESVELRPASPATETLTVVNPAGEEQTLRRRGDQPVVYRGTDRVGVYRVIEGGRESRRFAVNLFDPAESDVRLRTDGPTAAAALKIGATTVEAAAGSTPARKELWRWLVLAALGMLALEWFVYHRRAYL